MSATCSESQEKSKSDSLTLKPCPFCGCRVKLEVDIWGILGHPDYMTVYHPENDCILSDTTGGWSSTDPNEIIEAWNRRWPE